MTVHNDDEQTIARFVLRARRIEAHSLVRDWDELARHAQGSFRVHLDNPQPLDAAGNPPQERSKYLTATCI
jgi:hypothetical protein